MAPVRSINMANKAVGVALVSILAVFLMAGQACGERSMLAESWQVASAFAFNVFAEHRQELSSDLDIDVDQIGDMVATVNPNNIVVEFQVLPGSSGSFNTSEVNRIKEALDSGKLGTETDMSFYSDTQPLEAEISIDLGPSYYYHFTEFRQNVASVLGISQDQVGEVDVAVEPNSVVFDFELLPEFGDFDEREFNRIKAVLEKGDFGPVNTLTYSWDNPGALDAKIWTSESTDGDCENYLISPVYPQRRILTPGSPILTSLSGYNKFSEFREQASSILGVSQGQIGFVTITLDNPDIVVVEFYVYPESGSFSESDVKRMKDSLESGDFGTVTDLTYSTDDPGSLEATITTSDDEFTAFRQEVSSILGVGEDQIGDMEVLVNSVGEVVVFKVISASESFEENEIDRIKELLENGALGTLTDLTYSEDNTGALVITITMNDDEGYDDMTPTTSTGERRLLSELSSYDDDGIWVGIFTVGDNQADNDDPYNYYYVGDDSIGVDNTAIVTSAGVRKLLSSADDSTYLSVAVTFNEDFYEDALDGDTVDVAKVRSEIASALGVQPNQISYGWSNMSDGKLTVHFYVYPEYYSFDSDEANRIIEVLNDGTMGTLVAYHYYSPDDYSSESATSFALGVTADSLAWVWFTDSWLDFHNLSSGVFWGHLVLSFLVSRLCCCICCGW